MPSSHLHHSVPAKNIDRAMEHADCSLFPPSLPSIPDPSPAGTAVCANAADTHPGPLLDASIASKQTRLSAPSASHSAGLVCLERLPLNLPLSAPPGITSVAGAGCHLCCPFLFCWAPWCFCKVPPSASCARPHWQPPAPCGIQHLAAKGLVVLFWF